MTFHIINKITTAFLLLIIISCGGGGQEAEAQTADQTSEIRTVPVEVMVIKEHNLEAIIPFTSIIQPYSEVDIIAEVSGEIIKINKKLGDHVSTSDIIAVIDDEVPYNQFQQAKAQNLSAENQLSIAELNLESDKILFKNNDISQIAYENSVLALKNAEANLLATVANLSLAENNYENTKLQSSISGIISRDFVNFGSMVNIGVPLYRVVDLSKLKLEIGVSQDLINLVKVGTKAEVKIAALDNKVFEGIVKHVSPQADEQSGKFKAEIHVNNTRDMEIRAGMTTSIDLLLVYNNNKIAVPTNAIVNMNNIEHVYKIENNYAQLQQIETGQNIGINTIVNSGLEGSDTIVTVGMKNLGENTAVYIETID